ncbi:MAG TPA: hypothetical protein VML94_06635 [Thermoplasmata archaeon]|nr:hypothetical protein [Thermoplasmata archaeon]
MRSASIGRMLSVARQGLQLGIEYGPHSVEALLWIAETVEESVYRVGSLRGDGQGIRFTLGNPPLRSGAFSAVRLLWNGVPVDPAAVQLCPGGSASWRTAASLSPGDPIELHTGEPIEVAAAVGLAPVGASVDLRLELECPAIPPLVWIEFRDTVRRG